MIEAIDTNDPEHLKEELGDLMLQPVFHAAIAEENGNSPSTTSSTPSVTSSSAVTRMSLATR